MGWLNKSFGLNRVMLFDELTYNQNIYRFKQLERRSMSSYAEQ